MMAGSAHLIPPEVCRPTRQPVACDLGRSDAEAHARAHASRTCAVLRIAVVWNVPIAA